MTGHGLVTLRTLGAALNITPNGVYRRVMVGEVPQPAERTPKGFVWRLEDIRQANPALADAVERVRPNNRVGRPKAAV
jgi:hypothetical protein